MHEYAIRLRNVSKRYQIGPHARYQALRDNLAKFLHHPLKFKRRSNRAHIWALRDISLDVKPGEVVGIIGPNGAGKSTLLKIIARITEPTEGTVEIRGRVGSLLEVGAGFNMELTGRENIYLNGAILGMKKKEIDKKFDEIVHFAEVEPFIDTQVKYYSSGMFVRLAFAVAAHLEPHILLVDEVLAIGDASFQKKCLGKMDEVAHQGRTVLFVSHNMVAIRRLCTRAVYLNRGQLQLSGAVDKCIERYLNEVLHHLASESSRDLRHVPQEGTGDVKFLSIRVTDTDGINLPQIYLGQEFDVHIEFETLRPIRDLVVGLAIRTGDEFPLFATHWNDFGDVYSLEKGRYRTSVRIAPNYLRHGTYIISLGAIASQTLLAHIPAALKLTVQPVILSPRRYYDERIGALFIPMKWTEPVPCARV